MWFKRKKYIEVEIPEGYTATKPILIISASKSRYRRVVIDLIKKD
jgi:hypothetical protein